MKRKLIPLSKTDYTIGSMMKSAGYKTGCIGKWGLGNPGTTGTPDLHGFDYFYGYLDQVHAHKHYPSFLMENLDTLPIPENADTSRIYAPDLMLEASLNFITKNAEEPFFLYLPFTLPHGKYEIPDQGIYKDKDWTDKVRNYAAMITRMDHDIGNIFDLLKKLNIDKNTVVFFTSDNGPNPPFVKPLESNKPFRGIKRQLLEGGIRTPMIVRWPGQIPSGVTSDYQWAFWDVMATVGDICNVAVAENTDGISVLPTLRGQSQTPKEHLYWEYHSPFHQAVRKGNWKGIRTGTKDPIHLFDLNSDPKELNNLASANPEVIANIKAIMDSEHIESKYWPDVHTGSEATQKQLFEE